MSDKSQDYISRVHFKGYKSIKDLEIDLKPGLNIIIGPNGSGKTNFLEFLFKTRRQHFIEFPVFSSIKINKPDEHSVTYNWESEYSTDKGVRLVYMNREIKDGKETFISRWRVFEDKDRFEPPFEQKGDFFESSNVWDVPNLIAFGIPESFHKSMLEPVRISFMIRDNKVILLNTNEFENSLYLISNIFLESQNNYYESEINEPLISKVDFKALNQNLKNYSSIDEVRFDAKRVYQYLDETTNNLILDNLILQFFVEGKWLYWSQLSDGTKRMFSLISLVTYYPKFILLEEPELGIHPDQLYKIMDFLKEQSKEKQIILTTHSPEVLNTLGKDELDRIIVTRYDPEKGTQMHHLSAEHIEKAKVYMEKTGFLSDFWVHSNLEEYETAE